MMNKIGGLFSGGNKEKTTQQMPNASQKTNAEHQNKTNIEQNKQAHGRQQNGQQVPPQPNQAHFSGNYSEQVQQHNGNHVIKSKQSQSNLLEYKRLKQYINSKGFKQINGSMESNYSIAKLQYQKQELQANIKQCVATFPSFKQEAPTILAKFNTVQYWAQPKLVELTDKTLKSVRIMWKRKGNQCLMGYEIININYELNPNVVIEEQHQHFTGKQSQEGVYNGKDYTANMEVQHIGKQEALREANRQFNEDDLNNLKKLAKINDGKLAYMNNLLESGENQQIDY